MASDDDAHPPLRGARRGDVRAGEDRRVPAPVDRRGGDDRRRRAGAARRGLPDLDLPLARQRDRARHAAGAGDGRAVRARRRLLRRARRLDAHVRLRAPLHGRLRDRRRQPADRRGHRPEQRLSRPRRGDAVRVRRRRLQPGHVRRNAEPRRAVAAAGRVHGRQQPVRHGHLDRAPLGRDRPGPQGRVARRAGHALRRDGRARHLHGRGRGAAPRARGPATRCWWRPSPTASAATRWPIPRSTAQRRRSRSGASATRYPAFGDLLEREGILDAAAREGSSARRPSASSARWSSPSARPSRRPSRCTRTCTCSASRSTAGTTDDRPRRPDTMPGETAHCMHAPRSDEAARADA